MGYRFDGIFTAASNLINLCAWTKYRNKIDVYEEYGPTIMVAGTIIVHNSMNTHAVEQAEFFVREFLFFGNNVFGQFEKRIFVSPEELPDGDFDEGFDFEDVHNGGHRQPEEPSSVFTLRRGALKFKKKTKTNIITSNINEEVSLYVDSELSLEQIRTAGSSRA